jgi:hypothetical protein
VTIADARFDQRFDLHVAGADALAAYDHPFAYAAAHGLGLDQGRERVSAPLHC